MTSDDMKQLVIDMLNHMKVSYSEIEVKDSDGRVRVCVQSEAPRFLIGGNGQNLQALNHVIKRIAENRNAETPFSVDVNNYQETALEGVKNKALVIAERVRSYKTSIEMDPMSSYERMVVHSVLSEQPDVTTESSGMGRERRVVVKYSPSSSDQF